MCTHVPSFTEDIDDAPSYDCPRTVVSPRWHSHNEFSTTSDWRCCCSLEINNVKKNLLNVVQRIDEPPTKMKKFTVRVGPRYLMSYNWKYPFVILILQRNFFLYQVFCAANYLRGDVAIKNSFSTYQPNLIHTCVVNYGIIKNEIGLKLPSIFPPPPGLWKRVCSKSFSFNPLSLLNKWW